MKKVSDKMLGVLTWDYLTNTHTVSDNPTDFQSAMNIAVAKAYQAGFRKGEEMAQENKEKEKED